MQINQIKSRPTTSYIFRCARLKGRYILVSACLLFFTVYAFSQSTYLPQDDKAEIIMERMEIKSRNDSFFNFSKTKPYTREHTVAAVSNYLMKYGNGSLSKTDVYNAERVFMNNTEYVPDYLKYRSKKPILKRFYQTPANLYEVHVKDFDLIVNPVIQVRVAKESDNSETLYLNSRGLTLRGRIAKKIGFYAYLTDNQEKDPLYVRDWVNRRKAVPAAGFYKQFKQTGYDYFDARGYITFSATKYINVAFGYDKHFIGNGHRSHFLGNTGNANLFLKLNTRIWRINYQNLFMELQNADDRIGDRLIGKKYAAMHHLDVAVNRWLNIGLFEGVVFGRKDHFDFGYLNPIIFYRSIEQQNGSFDNSVAGLDVKANVAKKIQVYGQLCLDEFLVGQITKNNGYWGNKWAIQLGAKYIDAFGISNLDLQAEMNRVRPFTYSHRDSVANYTHYNQPMAHPLGAGFQELIGIARYQPAPRWLLIGKMIYYTQGRDSNFAYNYGSNIFLPNIPPARASDFGYFIGKSGVKTNVFFASFLLQYEFRENLFLELNAMIRKQDVKTAPYLSSTNSSIVSFGVRWNMHRREIDY